MKKIIIFLSICIAVSCHKAESVAPPVPVSMFPDQAPTGHTLNDSLKTDSTGIEVGVKFRSSIAVNIEGLKYYRTPGNIGNHVAQLYSSGGELLASYPYVNETDSGWQSVTFHTPVLIQPNTTYIAAYFSSLGYYASTDGMLQHSITNSTLKILADGEDGPNGVFKYTNSPKFTDTPYIQTYYWVDVIEK